MNRVGLLISLAALSASGLSVQADDLEEAYNRGYADGFAQGQSGSVMSKAGTAAISVGGSEFQTYIAPKSGTNLSVSDDSAVAIVPPASVEAFKEKLGTEFITSNKIMFNDAKP